jgi:hypothetical protein
VRVLLDESVPRQLAGYLTGHEVTTVPRQGWAGLRNGELLRRASETFDVLVTGDQGFEYQQNLSGLRLGVVVVAAKDNRVETIVVLAPHILQAIEAVQPGSAIKVAG